MLPDFCHPNPCHSTFRKCLENNTRQAKKLAHGCLAMYLLTIWAELIIISERVAVCLCFAACQDFARACTSCANSLTVPICPESNFTCAAGIRFDGVPIPGPCGSTGPVTCGGQPCTDCGGRGSFCDEANGRGDFDCNSGTTPTCGCFPADASVRLANGIKKRMDQLQPGDMVLAADPKTGALTYTTFTQSTHSLPSHMASFIAIRTAPSNKTLKLSPGHMLFRAQHGRGTASRSAVVSIGKLLSRLIFPGKLAGHKAEIVPARMITEGDVVFTSGHDQSSSSNVNADAVAQQQLHAETVVEVSMVEEVGIFSLHTHAANLVVDNVLASCYTEASGTYGDMFKMLPDSWSSLKHWITHQASLTTVLRHLHGSVPEWFLPKVKEMELKGGWYHLPYGERWAVVSEGMLAAARKRLGLLATREVAAMYPSAQSIY